MHNSSSFFENHDCEFYPCHDNLTAINCLFCYCPLYREKNCPGKHSYIGEKKIKDCSQCVYPHEAKNYSEIIRRLWNA